MKRGFTLIELLVVVAIIGILASLMVQGVTASLANAQAGACKQNLRQLAMANSLFASDHQEAFVAAAPDLLGSNLQRWHGVRDGRRDAFDSTRSPLLPYLGDAPELRRCPSLTSVRKTAADNAFEASCGGYGYNAVGIGSTSYIHGYNATSAQRGIPRGLLQHPFDTIMFADTAFPQPYRNPEYLIEYSFVEPYFFLGWNSTEESGRRATPSMHFRHRKRSAQIAWADGHVESATMGTPDPGSGTTFRMGWPGDADNALFRP